MYILLLPLVVSAARLHHELKPYDPSPNPNSVVVSSDGNLRVTVLTTKLFRIQYRSSLTSDWDDRPTLAVVNRNLESPQFKIEHRPEGLRIVTEDVEVYYKEGAGTRGKLEGSSFQAFNKRSLQSYKYGDSPTGNLLGTIRTLDTLGPTNLNCSTIIDQNAHCENGLISTDGWAVLNDTDSPRLAGPNDWWATTNLTNSVDMYLFMHGWDFKQALADYSKIGGTVPLPPRYMLGVLWTRWFDYDSNDLKDLVSGFSVRGLPLDTLIIDMNWHSKPWWGSYSFDKRIIPDPKSLVQWIKNRGVAVALNVHDCLLAEPGCPSGTITSDDDEIFKEYVSRVGMNVGPNATTIPLDLVNETLALTKEDVVFKSLESDIGIDMWWIDWQQGDSSGIGGLQGGKMNPTLWLNKIRYTNNQRWGTKRRSAVLSRFGGLGSHRYGQGFSGDVQMLDWDNLAYQPFFTATAANVLFPLWSHDVTGPNNDPELLVRWTQWSALSPMLRFHERGMSSGPCVYNSFPLPAEECANVDLWANLPGRFADAARKATLLRARLLPYMYTEVWKTYSTGVPWFRPLYYDFPMESMAYTQESQYMFGDDITVAPIVGRSSQSAPTATEWSVWAPPGLWYSPTDGALINGNSSYTRMWDLTEVPVLIRAGTLLAQRYVDPTHGSQKLVGLAMSNYTDIVFEVIPGAVSGSTRVYEDDAASTQYVDNSSDASGMLVASYERSGTSSVVLKVHVQGTFSNSITKRRIRLRLPDSAPIVSATSSSVTHKPRSHYDGSTLEAEVLVDWDLNVDGPSLWLKVECMVVGDLSGIRGAVAHARFAKAALDEAVLTPGTHPCWHSAPCGFRPEDSNLIQAAVVGERLNAAKSDNEFEAIITEFLVQYEQILAREVTVDNILRVDTIWAPTQGGWPEAVRLRVNYAVEMVNSALAPICESNRNLVMPTVCRNHIDRYEPKAHDPFSFRPTMRREPRKRKEDVVVIVSE